MASAHNRCNTFSVTNDHKYSQQDARMLKHQLNAVLQENIRSYIEHDILDISVDDHAQPEIRTITKKQQDDINVELNPHVKRLKQWDDDMTYVAKKFSVYCEMNQLKEQVLGIIETPKNPEKNIVVPFNDNDDYKHLIVEHSVSNEDNDDEKQIEISVQQLYDPFDDEKHKETEDTINEYTVHVGHDDDYYEFDGSILLRQYGNCTNLIAAHQARTDVIDEYIIPLNKTTNKLKQYVKRYTIKLKTANKRFNEVNKRYKETQTKRITLQERIKELMNELNLMIDAENEANVKCVEITNECNILKIEKNEYEKLLQKSRSLTTAHDKYMEDVESATNKINTYFVKRMEFHERNWIKWSSEDISNYIKFLNQTECENKIKLSNKIDLEIVAENINNHGVCGVTLDCIERNDWIHLGVQILDDRKQIDDKIQALVKKYPRKKAVENNINTEIPARFRCSISGTIMVEPVRCSDNKIYDKQNVLKYIQENGKLPETDEEYDEDDIMFKMRALKKEIDQFVSKLF